MLYGASALVGFGAALVWVAQGNFLTLNSDKSTMERNTGIFWVIYRLGGLIGNTFVYFQFEGLEDIDDKTRTTVIHLSLEATIKSVTFCKWHFAKI